MFICNCGRRSLFGKKDCETNAVTIYQKFESSNPSEQQIGTNVFLLKQEINRLSIVYSFQIVLALCQS